MPIRRFLDPLGFSDPPVDTANPPERLRVKANTDFDAEFNDGLTVPDTEDFPLRVFKLIARENATVGFIAPNQPTGPVADLFPLLERVQIVSRDEAELAMNSGVGENDTSVGFDNPGGDSFMPALRSIHVRGRDSLEVDVSDGRQLDGMDMPLDVAGEDFMPALARIRIVSREGAADLSLSTEGGARFMQALKKIEVYGFGTAEASISASVNFAGVDGADFMGSLESIRIVSEVAGASLSVSYSGAPNFMTSLRSIHVENRSDGGFSFADAELSLSASANATDGRQLLGINFMPALETITVISAFGQASASISHSGFADFLPGLRAIHVEATRDDPDDRAELSISASANTFSEPSFLGADFMASLETITVVSAASRASLSVSHSGGANFMANLRTVTVESTGSDSDARAEFSLSASANQFNDVALGGDNFMPMLESITVRAVGGEASLSISHSGSDNFLAGLRTIHVATTGAGDVQVSISASANVLFTQDDFETVIPETVKTGDNFMPALLSITVISAMDTASLSISHSGGENFMASLETIHVESKGEGTASISISASGNFVSEGPVGSRTIAPGTLKSGGNFMASLESITIVSAMGRASLSVSHSGGETFMPSVTSLSVMAGAAVADISISASANVVLTQDDFTDVLLQRTGADFMMALETITVSSAAGSERFERASLSISHSGGAMFMERLREVTVTNGGTGEADFDISASVNFTGAPGAQLNALETVTVTSAMGPAVIQIEAQTPSDFMAGLTGFTLESPRQVQTRLDNMGSDGFLPNFAAIDLESGTFLPDDAVDDPDSAGDLLEAAVFVRLANRFFTDDPASPGDDFMAALGTISVDSGRGTDIVLLNGGDGETEVPTGFGSTETADAEMGGERFLPMLTGIDITDGLDGDIFVGSNGDDAFGSLATVTVTAFQDSDPADLLDDIMTALDDSGLGFADALADRKQSVVEIDGNGFANMAPMLTDITVTQKGAAAAMDNDIGDIVVDLFGIDSAAFDVTLTTTEFGAIDVDSEDTPGLTNLTLSGDGGATVDLRGMQTGFALLDLTGMSAGSATTAVMNDASVAFGADFDVRIGSGDLAYTADGASESFIFTETDVGGADGMGVGITGFDTGAPAGTGDLLDLGALGVANAGELMIDDGTSDLVITSTDSDFTGSITLFGVDTAAEVADNFIFA